MLEFWFCVNLCDIAYLNFVVWLANSKQTIFLTFLPLFSDLFHYNYIVWILI